ncbi:hypothetical protein J1D01_13780 [Seonamhaeicola sp. NFXS20]|uniref:hypothetical protein n=1 Tax=Seonamhaeicola sp. NFXS20 TaxID=2816959 RepID=UPI003B8B9D77
MNKIKMFFKLLSNGKLTDILKIIKRRAYSNIYFFLLKQDLSTTDLDNVPKARIDISLRPFRDSDLKYFEDDELGNKLLEANIPTCYVAVTKDDIPCYRAWFFEPSQNDKTQAFFGYNFPKLKKDEFMVEMVHTRKEFRGRYIYVAANYLFLKMAKDLGYRWAVGCVDINNKAPLKGLNRSGCHPYKLQVTKWRFFTRKTIYVDIPEKIKAKYPRLKFPY